MGCDSPLKGWKDRHTGGLTFRREHAIGEKMEVACGQCLGCRLDYSRMWAMRIVHESTLWEYTGGNSFITLTYRDRYACSIAQLEQGLHVPDDWSLYKSHFQKFMKRLRNYFPDQEIRYFAAGEYGRKCKHGINLEDIKCPYLCNTGRPHFHACLFNCSFPDLTPYQTDGGKTNFTSPMLEKIWGYGFVDVGELNFGSASYTTKYILKKMKIANHPDYYLQTGDYGEAIWLEPEFVLMSRGNASSKGQRCGIGAGWYEKFKDDVFPTDEVPVMEQGVMNGVPRYYYDILRDEDPELFEEIRAKRQKYMKENAQEFTYDRLMAKHICKKARLDLKPRDKL